MFELAPTMAMVRTSFRYAPDVVFTVRCVVHDDGSAVFPLRFALFYEGANTFLGVPRQHVFNHDFACV